MKSKSDRCYRKIWESHFGPIPRDEDGRSYEIHHIDGNHDNYDITNLKLVSIQEHYDIHYDQGDWGACLLISERAKIPPEERSRLAKELQVERIRNGIHAFSKRADGSSLSTDMVKNGTHPFLGSQKAIDRNNKRLTEGNHNWQKDENGESDSSKRVAEGTHHFVTKNPVHTTISDGRHASQIRMCCVVCRGETSKNLFDRQHNKCHDNKNLLT